MAEYPTYPGQTQQTQSSSSIPWLEILGLAGGAAGAAAGARGQGRAQEAVLAHNADQIALNRSDQQRRVQALNALVSGMQDFNVVAPAGIPVGEVSGGARPSALIAQLLASQGGNRPLAPGQFGRGAAAAGRAPFAAPPGPTPLTESGGLDTFLSTFGALAPLAAKILQAVLDKKKEKPKGQPNPGVGVGGQPIHFPGINFGGESGIPGMGGPGANPGFGGGPGFGPGPQFPSQGMQPPAGALGHALWNALMQGR